MNTDNISDLECPHCGETFYYELTRCPNCGRKVYPSDFDDYEEEEGETEAEGWGVNPELIKPETDAPAYLLTGILIGGFVSNVLSILLFFILEALVSRTPAGSLFRYVSLISVPLGALVGGYVAGAYNEERPYYSGLIVGILSIGPAILITAVQRDIAVEPLVRPETIPWWGLTVLSGWGGAALSQRRTERQTLQQLFKPRSEGELYQDLLVKVQFDRLTAENLIGYERQRNPRGLRIEWIQSAIDRWERDNRV